MNRTRPFLFVLCLFCPAFSPSTAQARPPKTITYKVGLENRQYAPPEPYDWRGAKTHALVTAIWYPAEPSAVEKEQWIGSSSAPFGFAGKAAPGAPVTLAPGKLPLILLSHGFGGSSFMMAWLGTAL
ncbi:MAG TPA: hypothetical protein VFI95_09340, partial [Terriglobales bacterium]|nr:hypothetical protein [Terriglobales bacterium]